ncbi:SsrA-binding protein SmpB [Candidatus Peregrinibacteria bacterium]|nr:SsrA-binding protein SmpB [Candidatus Peregrinibacteria bacterium]
MKKAPIQVIAKNKKAYFNFEILEKMEAGIVLTGAEIKAVRGNRINLKGSYVAILRGEAWVENIHIAKYPYATLTDYEPKRKRKLLLRKKEIQKLALQSEIKGVTIVPLEVILKNNFAKIVIGLVRGKKKYDKREVIKKRQEEREIQKSIKKYSR